MPYVSCHARKRLIKRARLRGEERRKVVYRACRSGISQADTEQQSPLQRYLAALYFKHKKANNIRIYGRFVYIFDRNALITVLNLPEKYWDVADEIMRRKRVKVCQQ